MIDVLFKAENIVLNKCRVWNGGERFHFSPWQNRFSSMLKVAQRYFSNCVSNEYFCHWSTIVAWEFQQDGGAPHYLHSNLNLT